MATFLKLLTIAKTLLKTVQTIAFRDVSFFFELVLSQMAQDLGPGEVRAVAAVQLAPPAPERAAPRITIGTQVYVGEKLVLDRSTDFCS